MKITIRRRMFETNSSSTHTCIICKNDDEYKGFKSGKYCYYNRKFIHPEELEIKGIKYNTMLEDIDSEDFDEKYKDIFYYTDDITDEESLKTELQYHYDVYFYDRLRDNHEEFIGRRDEIKVLCFVGFDG